MVTCLDPSENYSVSSFHLPIRLWVRSRRDGMLDLMFGTKLLPLPAGELCAVVCNDLAWDAEPVYDAIEEFHCCFHAYILERLSFHPLGEGIDPDEKKSVPSRSGQEWYQYVYSPDGEWPAQRDGVQLFGMHHGLLLKELTILASLDELNSILPRRWPIKPMSERLADDSSERIMCPTYATVDIPQQGYTFIFGDTLHQHAAETPLEQFSIDQSIELGLPFHPLCFRAVIRRQVAFEIILDWHPPIFHLTVFIRRIEQHHFGPR